MKAVDGRAEVFLDGGVRQGTDALKALAMGARAVFVGRPVLWGLAYKVSVLTALLCVVCDCDAVLCAREVRGWRKCYSY